MKDVIITGGENVASQEVEGALRGHPDILDVAVVGRPHSQWGETVVAVVVPRAGRGWTWRACASGSGHGSPATHSRVSWCSATNCRVPRRERSPSMCSGPNWSDAPGR